MKTFIIITERHPQLTIQETLMRQMPATKWTYIRETFYSDPELGTRTESKISDTNMQSILNAAYRKSEELGIDIEIRRVTTV
jgi:hypothetical protein